MGNKEWENDQILEESVQYFKERGEFKWTEGRERKEENYRQADLLLRMVTCIYGLQVADHVTHGESCRHTLVSRALCLYLSNTWSILFFKNVHGPTLITLRTWLPNCLSELPS